MSISHSIKRMGSTMLIASALGLGASSWAQAAPITDFNTLTQHEVEQSYYHDWNRNPKFRASVRQLFVRSNVPMLPWVRHGAGPSAPSRVVQQDGTTGCYSTPAKCTTAVTITSSYCLTRRPVKFMAWRS